MTCTTLGDQALLVEVGTEAAEHALARVLQIAAAVRAASWPWVREIVTGPASLALMLTDDASCLTVGTQLEQLLRSLPVETAHVSGRERDVPVCYDQEFGLDLVYAATRARVTVEQLVKLHTQPTYRVHAVGFSPGFPYLLGLPDVLHLPRRPSPRTRVPAGSVGIGGQQTGIYPLETPGGWQIIGRTPRLLFEPLAAEPAWLQPGDRVRFHAISREEHERWAAATEEARRASLPVSPARATGAAIEVVRPGIQTTVQDTGRFGWQAHGVPISGAVDALTLRVANRLVGNAPDAAGLEWAVRGPVLKFNVEAAVAILGAEPAAIAAGRPQLVRAGDILDLTHLRRGHRGYLAIGGGIDVPVVLNSRSTCLAGRFGGYRGRPLRAGDQLHLGEPPVVAIRSGWSVHLPWLDRTDGDSIVRIVRGPHTNQFGSLAWRVLTEARFQVRAESDRMGLRLAGATLRRGT
ncbi:MAG TPA: 5-oxoprolinase subunit PxpB, partial [Candidatus Synoicihabitans sp.]|nr:5-oxoprolinase subunit PxpB [Candidatus Synoicihabitans sp.]